MQARELIKISNFKHYYFIINKDYVKNNQIDFEFKLTSIKGTGQGKLILSSDTKNSDIDESRFYDIGYSFQKIATCKLNCENVAKYVDTITYKNTKTKVFKIHRLENYDGILYIHLLINKE